MAFGGKRSGQIPAFGDWDNANGLPITQYFESARQAGLVRHTSALTTADQSQRDQYMTNVRGSCGRYPIYPYAANFQKPSARLVTVPPRKLQTTGGAAAVNDGQTHRRRRCGCPPHVKEQIQQQQQQQRRIKQHGLVPVQVNVYDVVDVKQQLPTSRTRSQQFVYNNGKTSTVQNQKKQTFPKHTASAVNVKPVDEDLYKIPPELLLQHHNSKRKKMLGFFSKCLAPPCKA